MVAEVVLLSFLCGILGTIFIAVPYERFDTAVTLVFKCRGAQDGDPITLYDHVTGIFTTYHDIARCDSLLVQGGRLHLVQGNWVESHSVGFFRCPPRHFLSDMFNPASPRKKSVHIDFRSEKKLHGLHWFCGHEVDFHIGSLYSGRLDSYVNFVFPTKTDCSFTNRLINPQDAFGITIQMGSVTDTSQEFGNIGNGVLVVAPEVSSEVVEGHRYIFKISVLHKNSNIFAIETCLKNSPNGECTDYQIRMRSKGNSDVISFPISKISVEADAYVEIHFSSIFYNSNLNIDRQVSFTYRVNERILEAYRRKIIQKFNEYAIINVHVLECENGDNFCDTEGTRKFDVTVYGVATPENVKDLYIQGVKINNAFECNGGLSQCRVTVSMEKYRHTTLEYGRGVEALLGLLMADSNSYTGVFKDISITAVAKEEI